MASSKKKRGKQRMAAKNQGLDALFCAAAIVNANETSTLSNITPNITHKFIEYIRKGEDNCTKVFVYHDISNWYSGYNGIVPIALNFLKRCEHETFARVMADVGGDLLTPSAWVIILLEADLSEPSCRLQIAQNMRPLIRCLSADTRRVFFKSNKYWRESVYYFGRLIYNMMTRGTNEPTDEEREIVHTLLQHEGLLRTIVQWGFWRQHRPDIIKELGFEDCTDIVDWGEEIIEDLLFDISERESSLTEEDRNVLDIIGTTPIVSKDFDPSCMVSYVYELLRRLKVEKSEIDQTTLQLLLASADCIDKGVITEVIDFGFNFTDDYNTASHVARMSCNLLIREIQINVCQQCDTRTAFAIRAGLIEMCLSLIEGFRGHVSFGRTGDCEETSLFEYLRDTINNVHSISLHMKSAKAIRSKRNCIEEKLMQVGQNKAITSDEKCKELLDMVRSIVDLNGAYCCRCNKSLDKKEIKRCNGCNRMTYCSKACQKEDWSSGHNLTCGNKEYTHEQAGVFQGRILRVREPECERAAAKLKALEQNVNMIQLKLFLDNSETILSQASSLGIPLRDCVVEFDLRCCPPSIEVACYMEEVKKCHVSPQEMKHFEEGFEDTRLKENITCIYYSWIRHGYMDEDGDDPFLAMQKFFPHEWLSTKSTQK